MALILTRSPFHISRGNLDANASLTVQVSRGQGSTIYPVETYNLNFRNNLFIDISNLCASVYELPFSYVENWGQYITSTEGDLLKQYETGFVVVTLTGNINGVEQDEQVTTYSCSDGYVYSSEKFDKDFTSELQDNSFYAGSSDIIYKLDDSNLRIPIFNPTTYSPLVIGGVLQVDETVSVSFRSKGEIVFTDTIYYNGYGDATNSLSQWGRTFDYDSFLNRINEDDGELELSQCINEFFDENKIDDVDEVYISSSHGVKILKVKTVEECKYNPYRITFKNRYGVMEDLWFFKKSVESISVKGDEFRANQFKQRSAGGRGRDAGLIRSNQEYNKNGTTSITLNYGFVDEALNESFKQLMLSEEVELYDFNNDVRSAVKIKDSELKLKTSTNDKLINYTIEVEFSNSIIDNIV